MRILLWHVHGGWMDGFVRGPHRYVVPVDAEHGPWGLGLAGRPWPHAVEATAEDLASRGGEVDAVVLQRTEEIELVRSLTGLRPGVDVPAVFVEHNTPKGSVPNTRHPLADQTDIPIVHVTHFNALMWDSGRAPVFVVEHGVRDPGLGYTGELERLGVAVNEPVRRGRVAGTDLLPAFSEAAPIDVFGMGGGGLAEATGVGPDRLAWAGDLPSEALHAELARRRAYLHPFRWTSLGLALIEAMFLGLPVLVVGATEAWRAVPPEAGCVSSDPKELIAAARRLLAHPGEAAEMGHNARKAAQARYGLDRFHAAWDEVLAEAAGGTRGANTLKGAQR
ncbi:Transferase [Sinomonas atrocyanea]|uniref:Transferase n=1 Tax=Sinomonas atrocyanea TaxID=37927 RepID=A0A126ZW24_9MICC|nr:glycosyltransferase [Sinomonas atrocyanea]AMM31379.1 Transferase [Sinomonas atrocyanea]GEB64466.1 glycosyl transferase [Sinomonas atrocyanea]GGG62668.1 glycosyl transferase [Sinomonas atrocyanea]